MVVTFPFTTILKYLVAHTVREESIGDIAMVNVPQEFRSDIYIVSLAYAVRLGVEFLDLFWEPDSAT